MLFRFILFVHIILLILAYSISEVFCFLKFFVCSFSSVDSYNLFCIIYLLFPLLFCTSLQFNMVHLGFFNCCSSGFKTNLLDVVYLIQSDLIKLNLMHVNFILMYLSCFDVCLFYLMKRK